MSRKFKQITGENLSDYLTGLRVEKAKALLQNTNLRLSQIAELVGYEDEKYFSRVFKNRRPHTKRIPQAGRRSLSMLGSRTACQHFPACNR
ncbi:helix-turn-helix transcriptional regulator [Paenibacillus rhizoplanae]